MWIRICSQGKGVFAPDDVTEEVDVVWTVKGSAEEYAEEEPLRTCPSSDCPTLESALSLPPPLPIPLPIPTGRYK